MKIFLSFLRKDFLSALRGKELIFSSAVLAILVAVLFMCGIQNAFIPPPIVKKIIPVFYWFGLLCICLLTISRSFSDEHIFGGIERILLMPGKASAFFLAKVFSTALITSVTGIFFRLLLSLFVTNQSDINGAELSIIPFFVTGFTALATILTAMSVRAAMQDVLLSLTLLPLCFPLFFAALELTYASPSGFSAFLETPWLTLLALLDIVYL